MAFTLETWAKNSSSANGKAPVAYTYKSAGDALATIAASAYFNTLITRLAVDDLIYVSGSDGVAFYHVTSVTTNVTVAAV